MVEFSPYLRREITFVPSRLLSCTQNSLQKKESILKGKNFHFKGSNHAPFRESPFHKECKTILIELPPPDSVAILLVYTYIYSKVFYLV